MLSFSFFFEAFILGVSKPFLLSLWLNMCKCIYMCNYIQLCFGNSLSEHMETLLTGYFLFHLIYAYVSGIHLATISPEFFRTVQFLRVYLSVRPYALTFNTVSLGLGNL